MLHGKPAINVDSNTMLELRTPGQVREPSKSGSPVDLQYVFPNLDMILDWELMQKGFVQVKILFSDLQQLKKHKSSKSFSTSRVFTLSSHVSVMSQQESAGCLFSPNR